MGEGLNKTLFFQCLQTFFFFLALRASLRTADVFPVVASLPPKNNNNNNSYFSEGEKRRPEIRLRFAG